MNIKLYSNYIFKLLLLWLVIPAITAFLTWLGFMAILNYYAPYGKEIVIPLTNKFSEPMELVKATEVFDNQSVIQPFNASLNGLGRIDLQMVTFGDRSRPNDITWQLNEVKNDGTEVIQREGKFPASKVKDWGFLTLKFAPIIDSACKHYELSFFASRTPQNQSIGFPMFKVLDSVEPDNRTLIVSENARQRASSSQSSLVGSFSYYDKFN